MRPSLLRSPFSSLLRTYILACLAAITIQAAPPVFSPQPEDAEILRTRVFREPLAKTAGATTSGENQALAAAIVTYANRSASDDVSALAAFVSAHPASPWNAALKVNLGLIYYDNGYFSKAIESWQQAWAAAKAETSSGAARIANRAVTELIRMDARLGRMDSLTSLLEEIKDRPITGGTGIVIDHSKDGLWLMQNRPGVAFKCGPFAVENVMRRLGTLTNAASGKIHDMQSTQQGTSLAQVAQLAKDTGLDYQPVKRVAGAPLLLPAIIHWKVGHYAALVSEEGNRYKVVDPTFGEELLISRDAIETESSGYFLVRSGPLPEGWQTVDDTEARTVWGKGQTSGNDPKGTTGCDKKSSSACTSCNGMAVYSVHALLVSLNIMDTPVGYTPPIGPAVFFRVSYNQRDIGQTSGLNYSNLGTQWTHDWFSYVQINSGTADVFARGGGINSYINFNSATQSYTPTVRDGSVLVKVSASSYELRYLDGAKDVFGLDEGSGRFFLTQVVDTVGNAVTLTYDPQYYRLTAITDALGQKTTLSYELVADPLKITKVTDHFKRSATFEYDAALNLVKITDTVGLTSEFTYSGTDITSLITAYGTTTFVSGTSGLIRWLEVTDPQGDKERTEYRNFTDELPYAEPYAPLNATNRYLYYRNTFYWDKKAMAEGYPDVHAAHIYHWLHDGNLAGRILESEKLPYETRKYYTYAAAGNSYASSDLSMFPDMNRSPFSVSQVVADANGAPVDQVFQTIYDVNGNLVSSTDPLGRQTTYVYATNHIDLLETRQTTGASTYDVLSSATYSVQHLPLTMTDGAGKTTTLTYNAVGQLSTATNAKSEVTHFYYDPTGDPAGSHLVDGSRDPAGVGYLVAIDGPLTGLGDTTTFAYDSAGRVRTMTDPEGYSVVIDYDNLNRPTKRTYPDGTYEQITYDRLDVGQSRDRLGRVTINTYNAIRQLVQVQDPLNRITLFDWCKCGALLRLTDAAGNATTWWHNVQGQLTAKFYPDGTKVTYAYETVSSGTGPAVPATSRLKTVTDAMGQTTNYTYYVDGSIHQVSYGNATVSTPSVSYAYDPVYLRLTGMTDGTGTTGYTYYPAGVLGAGRVDTVNNPLANSDFAFSYDELGRLVSRSVNGAANAETIVYDARNRVTDVTNALGGFTYDYVANTARVKSVEYPNGQVSNYSYYPNTGTTPGNGDHRLSQIQHLLAAGGAALSTFGYTYDANGTIQTWSQQAGAATPAVHTFAYDAADQLTGDSVSTGAAYGYGYDSASNRVHEQIGATTTYAAHNANNQLTGLSPSSGTTTVHFAGTVDQASTVTVNGVAATPGGPSTSFAADIPLSAGASTVAVTATTPAGTATQSYQVAVGNPATDTSLIYDLNGNLVSQTGGTLLSARTYGWDAASRLVSITQGSDVTTFVYDGMGRRVAEKLNGTLIKQWVWYEGNAQPCEERDANNTVSKRFYAQGEQIGGTIYFYTKDHLGSIRELTDATGAVRARYDYDPYGRRSKVTGDFEADFGYTGHYYHVNSGLHLTLFRAYDSNMGRWLSRDPMENAEISEGPNVYSYASNSPIDKTDRWGLWGVGATVAASAEGGIGPLASAGANVAVGHGIFLNQRNGQITPGGFVAAGAFANLARNEHSVQYPGPCDNGGAGVDPGPWALGASVGIGKGVFLTNAASVDKLAGRFNQVNINTPWGSFSFGWGGGIFIASVTRGPGKGASISSYPTNTFATAP